MGYLLTSKRCSSQTCKKKLLVMITIRRIHQADIFVFAYTGSWKLLCTRKDGRVTPHYRHTFPLSTAAEPPKLELVHIHSIRTAPVYYRIIRSYS